MGIENHEKPSYQEHSSADKHRHWRKHKHHFHIASLFKHHARRGHSHIQHSQTQSDKLMPKIIESLAAGYTLRDFSKDLVAGFTVSIVALPLAMAFAMASALTPIHGIYTAMIAGIVCLFFAGCKFQVNGPSGAFVILTYSIVYRFGYDGLVITLILTGILLTLAGLFRVGSLIKFIPYPVIVGFGIGIALIIASQQFASFLGLPLTNIPPEFFEKLYLYGTHITEISFPTLAFSLVTVAVMLLSPKITKKIPSPVVGVLFGILAVSLFGLPLETIQDRFGNLPQVLPSFHMPYINFELIQLHFPDAITLALLVSIESLLTAVVADACTPDKHYSNMELISQGLSNMFSGLFGGIPSTGGTSRTITNINAGAVSPIASFLQACFLAIFVFFFPSVIGSIPLASLSVILIFVAYGMVDVHGIRMIFASSKLEATIFLLTFLLTIAVDLTVAVYIGVTFASLAFMQRMSTHTSITADRSQTSLHPLDAEFSAQENLPDGVRIIHIDGPLFFGVADRFQSALSTLGENPRVYILHMKHVSTVDSTGIHAIEVFVLRSVAKGYKVVISSPTEEVKHFLKRIHMLDKIGLDNICDSLKTAIARAEELLSQD